MTDKTDFIKNLKTMISLRSDGNHADLSDEYEGAYIEGQAEYITDLFIEQACEAIASKALIPEQNEEMRIHNLGLWAAQQAIREKFSE